MGIIFMVTLVFVFLMGAFTIYVMIKMDEEHKQRMKRIDERRERWLRKGFRLGP